MRPQSALPAVVSDRLSFTPGASCHRQSRAFAVSVAVAFATFLLAPASLLGRPRVPAPATVLGFEPCADYKLADSETIDRYLQALDRASDRLTLVEIGRSTDGRPLRLAIVSSEENLRKLDRYRAISAALATGQWQGRPLGGEDAQRLAEEGRAVVWVDFGLHSTEVAGAQTAPRLAWQLVTDESVEARTIRDNVILLLMPDMNPDGTTLVSSWYRQQVGTLFERSAPPALYHRYAGHDNNRDWYMFALAESRAVARQLYDQWFPQIVYNQHQEAPFPARIFVPPFADPVNPEIPPLVVRGINLVGDAITRRLEREGKSGAISRVEFDGWWNGGMRSAPDFHNMIGILTETAHASASPSTYDASSFPKTFSTGDSTTTPSAFYPSPYRGGRWRLADSCDYMMSASLAVLDLAARRHAEWLIDIYNMGQQAVRAGAEETWLIPADQWDPPTAVKLVNVLRRGGVEVEVATAAFTAGDRSYAPGTFVIRGSQPFRAYVRDLLGRQQYPDRRVYPGGPPQRPYDITGWTLPLQMGVQVDFVSASVTVDTTRVDVAPVPGAAVAMEPGVAFALDPRVNDSVRAVNRLMKSGGRVSRLAAPLVTRTVHWPAGAFLIDAASVPRDVVVDVAHDLGLNVVSLGDWPASPRVPVTQARVGVYQSWTANSDEGWTRFVLEAFEFPYRTLHDADVRAGQLRQAFDVIVLPSDTYDVMLNGAGRARLPEPYAGGLGPDGVHELYEFVATGGTLVAMDRATELPLTAFGLPIRNVLANARDTDVYVPGSLLQVTVDASAPIAWGMPAQAAAFFARSAAFDRVGGLTDNGSGVSLPVTYAKSGLLLSGFELGGDQIAGHAAVADVRLGRGRVVLLGFRVQHRAQPHGTFKLLFNALLGSVPAGEQ
jgi:Zinc carboxypeptidase